MTQIPLIFSSIGMICSTTSILLWSFGRAAFFAKIPRTHTKTLALGVSGLAINTGLYVYIKK